MKILLVDDHQMFLDGLTAILQRSENISQLQSVNNGHAALSKLEKEDFDVALIDLRLPVLDGFGVLQAAFERGILTAIIVVTASNAPDDVIRAKKLGAMGYISKSASSAQILDTISRVANGELVFPASSGPFNSAAQATSDYQTDWAGQHSLTPRQVQVVRLLKQGMSNQQIANTLFVSIPTVKTHIAAIFKILDVKSRAETISKIHQLGLD